MHKAAKQVLFALHGHTDAGEDELRLLLLDLGNLAEGEGLLWNERSNGDQHIGISQQGEAGAAGARLSVRTVMLGTPEWKSR